MPKALFILILCLSAYLISERSVERIDQDKENEKIRIREMILIERKRLQDEVNVLRNKDI
jgi:hypothetical protein